MYELSFPGAISLQISRCLISDRRQHFPFYSSSALSPEVICDRSGTISDRKFLRELSLKGSAERAIFGGAPVYSRPRRLSLSLSLSLSLCGEAAIFMGTTRAYKGRGPL